MAHSHIHDSVHQCREDMRRIEAEMAETVRLTRSAIDESRRSMAELDRLLAWQAARIA
jgi:hypothetical protein